MDKMTLEELLNKLIEKGCEKWKDIDYWMLILNRYYWLQENQMECDVYFKSYIRLNRILNKMDDEGVSREYDEDMF